MVVRIRMKADTVWSQLPYCTKGRVEEIGPEPLSLGMRNNPEMLQFDIAAANAFELAQA